MTKPDKHGWLPIESAPKGEWVLVFSEERSVEKAHFSDWDRWEIFQTAEYDNEYHLIGNPTHWQPLPAPPENES